MSENPKRRSIPWALPAALAVLGLGILLSTRADRDSSRDSRVVTIPTAKPKDLPQFSSSGVDAASTLPVTTAESPTHEQPVFTFNHSENLPADFMERMVAGNTASFSLPDGRTVRTAIELIERDDHGILFVQGSFRAPEPGFFYFHRQTSPGVAGPFFGHVRFHNHPDAWKIEPGADLTTARLVRAGIDEILCVNYSMPPDEAAMAESDSENAPQTHPSDLATVPLPSYQNIIALQSLPGAVGVVYLDFDGETGPFSGWGSFDAAPANATNAQIYDVWKMVSEDFQGFTLNVTTDRKVYDAAPEGRRIHCIVTPTTTAAPGAGGVAYIGSFNSTGDQVCWAFYSTGKSSAEVISHEVGHTLKLRHDGRVSPAEEYYGGHGTDPTGWAPIMGVGYYKKLSQWSKGEYLSANRTEDDLAMIVTNNSVSYRADDMGDTLTTASYLEISSSNTVSNEGIIERSGDVDAFRFVTTGGLATLNINPVTLNPNLDVLAEIVDAATATVVATSNPDLNINATFSTTLAAGEYLLRIRGTGRGDPLGDGYTNYGSLGSYLITGSVAGGIKPERFSVAENSASGTTVGTVIPRNNHEGAPITYAITSGNPGGAFAIDPATGAITVANPATLDYESLSLRWDDPSTIELFVTISNPANPALDETLRTVVTVTNVNESPALTGGAVTMLEKTRIGTPVFTVTGNDPDRFDFPVYSITAGNTGNAFAIHSGTGQITVAATIDITEQTIYSLTIQGADKGTPTNNTTTTVTINVMNIADGYQPGQIVRTYFEGISGSTISNLTNATSKFPNNPDSEEFLQNFDGGQHGDTYGSTIRGYVIPPTTGSYRFWIASDDASALLISTNTSPANAISRATVSSYTNPYSWGTGSQQSAFITLTAGQPYYIEARHKEGSGGDHLSVAWSGPGISKQLLSGLYLAPYYQNYAPKITATTFNVRENTLPPRTVGTVPVSDVNKQDTFSNFTITSGNTDNVFGIHPTSGALFVAKQGILNAAVKSSYTLGIQTTDNGSPALPGSGTVTVNILPSDNIAVSGVTQEIWTGISGSTLTNLTGNSNYPLKANVRRTLSNFDSGTNYADYYGSRIRALFIPPESGDYRFYISGDDDCRLLFSTNPSGAGAASIATISGWTAASDWTKYTTQTSGIRTLVAGQAVYLESLQKEGSGGDHVMVGYTSPSNTSVTVIPGSMLQPFNINAVPTFASGSYLFNLNGPSAINGSAVGTVSATEPNGETLIYAITSGNASGAFSINSGTGAITVNNSASLSNGDFNLQVAAQDQGLSGSYPLASATTSVVVRVSGFPAAPVFTANPLAKPAAIEDTAYSQTLAGAATDANAGDTINYSKIDGPAWLAVAADGTLTGTPSETNNGPNAFTIRATDSSGLFAEATLNIDVTAVNDPPLWVTTPPGSALLKDTPYDFTATAADPDAGDLLTVSKISGPAWLNVAGDGTLYGIPSATDAGENAFVIRVTDGGGLFAEAGFTLTVVANPTWTQPSGGTWPASGNWLAGLPANASGLLADFSTLDLTTDATITLDGSRTVGHLVFSDTTPSHHWIIAPGSGGSITLNVASGVPSISVLNGTATLSTSLAGIQGFTKTGAGTLALTAGNAYSGPTLIADGTLLLTGSLPADGVSVSAGAVLAGTGIANGPVSLSGNLSPGIDGVGTLTTNSALSLLPSSSIDWQITQWNGSAGTGHDQIICPNVILSATPTEKCTLRITAPLLADFNESGKSFVLIDSATTIDNFDPASFQIDATGFSAGSGTWSVAASGTDIVLIYTRTNAPPEFNSEPVIWAATQNQAFSAALVANDADLGETLTYSKFSGPAWLTVAPSGAVTGMPGNAEVGTHVLTVQVTDSFNAIATKSVTIDVADINDPPSFIAPSLAHIDTTEGVALTGSLASSAIDPDVGDWVSYSKASGPLWLTVASDGSLAGTPLSTDLGTNTFIIRATDTGGLVAESTLVIQVAASNADNNSNGIPDNWEEEKFGNADPGANPANLDEDGDGLSNLMEFALDTHPAEGTPTPLESTFAESENGPVLQLTIPKNPLAENLIYVVEVCDDPVHGTWSAAPTVVVSETANQMIVRDSQPAQASKSRFMRLRVSTSP